jgi:hypothetical protein
MLLWGELLGVGICYTGAVQRRRARWLVLGGKTKTRGEVPEQELPGGTIATT